MSKGSGSTRSLSPSQSTANIAETGYYSKQQYEHLLESVGKNQEWNKSDRDIWDEMNDDQRYLALMESGFTGLSSDDDIEIGNLYYATSKKELVSWLAEQMANEATDYGSIDVMSFAIGYEDGSVKHYDSTQNDFNLSKITNNQNWETQQATVNSIIQTGKIRFILYSDAWGQPQYYVKNDKGMQLLKKYGGFEEWKKGRGEKKRDYIQDDWV